MIVTLFSEHDLLDFDDLERQIEHLSTGPFHWIAVGFGSEIARLSPFELDELLRKSVVFANGRIGVIGNAEVTGVQPGLAAIGRVADVGAAVAMVRPSSLEGIPQDELFDMFRDIGISSPIPLIVQDAPQTTSVELSAATLARLLNEVSAIVAAKVEPPASAHKISQLVHAAEGNAVTVLGGLGGRHYLQELERGGCGTMPGPAYAEVLTSAERRLHRGDRAGAHQLMARVAPFADLGSRDMDTFRFLHKHLLSLRGIIRHTGLRHPHNPIDPRFVEEINELVESLSLLELLDECAMELADTKSVGP